MANPLCELCGKNLGAPGAACEDCRRPEVRHEIESAIAHAVRVMAEEIRSEPGRGDLHYQLGNFYRLGGRFEEAVACYEKALQEPQAKPQYYHALATAAIAKGDYGEAVEALRKAIALAPQYPDYHNDLGACFFREGHYEEALAAFREAIRLHPGYANAYNNMSFVFRKKRMYEEAERAIRKALALDPEHAVADYALGLGYFNGGMFSQIRDTGPMDAVSLGKIYAMGRNFEKAVELLSRAVSIHPRYADYHLALGEALAASGQKQKAEAAFQKALEINPAYKEAQQALEKLKRGNS